MIVVVGAPAWNPGPPPGPGGRAASIAVAAAEAGSRVELLGRIGDDPTGDALVIALSRAAVGHAALLRDPVRPTLLFAAADADEDDVVGSLEAVDGIRPAVARAPGGPSLEAADVSLGLRYLADFAVLVVGDDAPAPVIPACAEAAAFAGAQLVVVVASSDPVPGGLPVGATVLQAPDDGGEAFGRLLGRYAAALDGGADPAAAFTDATADGWEHPGS